MIYMMIRFGIHFSRQISDISEVQFNPFSEIDTGETFLSVDSDLDPDKTILKELKIKSISVNIMMEKVSRN